MTLSRNAQTRHNGTSVLKPGPIIDRVRLWSPVPMNALSRWCCFREARTWSNRAGALGGGRSGHVATVLVGPRETLVGQPGLADARRAVDHESVCSRVVEGAREQLDLLVSPDKGPLEGDRGARRSQPYWALRLPLRDRGGIASSPIWAESCRTRTGLPVLRGFVWVDSGQ
jgi:hypothetical protein